MATIQILKTQTEIPVLEKQIKKEKKIGRPQKITTEDLINAIKLYATTSPSELSKRLNVARQTIYRRMKLIPKETIFKIFKELDVSELKPYQMTYEGFLTIPEIQQFKKALERRQVCQSYKNALLRTLWYTCIYLKKHPRNLSVEECADLLTQLKQVKIKNLNYYSVKRSIRSYFQNVYGINGEILTSKGIDGSRGILGKRAHDRLTKEQRHAFIHALKEIIRNDDFEKSRLKIWISLPYFLYYTATRIHASLKARIENIDRSRSFWTITVVDKGRHKNGRKIWRKFIIGELKQKLEENLKSRGNPKKGWLFPFYYKKVRTIFVEAYKKAGIPKPKQPCHIWRHTSAQDFLEATDWNYELCAQILGWEDSSILRKCYGSISEKAKERALRKAMAMPIKESKKKEFKF